MKRNFCFYSLICLIAFFSFSIRLGAQPRTDMWLQQKLRQHASPLLQRVLNTPDSFHYQLIYTKIDRNRKNRPQLQNYYLRVDRNDYFNPASTVKLPTALVALEKINGLKEKGISKYSTMLTDSSWQGQSAVLKDSSSADGLPSIAQYIRKVFLVSDNEAYNRLYEFDGQEYLNESLWKKGYKDTRITRRFAPATEEGNRHTNGIRFMRNDTLLYEQPPAYSRIKFDFSKKILVGKGHWDEHDSLINEPMDFTKHNNLPLEDLQRLLQSVILPESVPEKQRFHLTADDYAFLYRYMSGLPSQSDHPRYDTTEYFDSYTKFFLFRAGRSSIPPYIKVFNKTGWSFGYLTDAAYIVDVKHNVEFMLTGTIYVNSDGILNDNKYEYEEIGYPFFREVGNIIYQYELERKRKRVPDLQKFSQGLPK